MNCANKDLVTRGEFVVVMVHLHVWLWRRSKSSTRTTDRRLWRIRKTFNWTFVNFSLWPTQSR